MAAIEIPSRRSMRVVVVVLQVVVVAQLVDIG